MPIENDVGMSECTALKQDHFRGLMKMSLGIVSGIFKRYKIDDPFFYFDLNSGPGRYGQFVGSPLIFKEEAEKIGIKHKAMFFERNEQSHAELEKNIGESSNYITINGDHDRLINFPGLAKPFHGMLYSDENGTPPPWAVLQKFFQNKNHSKIDCVIYVSATNIKRVFKAWGSCHRLVDGMSLISKKYWLVRKPVEKHQWTFLIGTNWADFPKWEKSGFYKINEPIGESILERLNHTSKELEEIRETRQLQFSYAI